MRKRINNDHRRAQADRYGKYVIAADNLGIEIPRRFKTKSLTEIIVYLSKQDDVKIWPAVVAEAARLFPETFQHTAQL